MTDNGLNLFNFLQANGFEPGLLGGNCPFQIEGNHCSGFSIYFRARGTTASLEIYDEHYDYFSGLPNEECLIWSGEFECWEEYEAGWITHSEAFYVFHALWSDAKEEVLE